MLTDRQDIAIWIFKPRYLVPRRSGPDSEFTILNEGILFQDNAPVPEPRDDGFDIFYFPAEDRTLERDEIGDFGNPDLVSADAHDQSVLIEAYELKTEVPFIESPRLVVILCGNKPNNLSRSEHLFLPSCLFLQIRNSTRGDFCGVSDSFPVGDAAAAATTTETENHLIRQVGFPLKRFQGDPNLARLAKSSVIKAANQITQSQRGAYKTAITGD